MRASGFFSNPIPNPILPWNEPNQGFRAEPLRRAYPLRIRPFRRKVLEDAGNYIAETSFFSGVGFLSHGLVQPPHPVGLHTLSDIAANLPLSEYLTYHV